MKTFLLSLIIVAGAGILMVQWSHRRDLEKDLRLVVSARETTSKTKLSQRGTSIKKSNAPSMMISKLERYLDSIDEKSTSVWSPEFVSLLSTARAEDLRFIINQIEVDHPDELGEGGRYEGALKMLKLLHRELDPVAVLESDTRAVIFEFFARRSPEEALRWLESASLPADMKETFMNQFHMARFAADPAGNLEYWESATITPFTGFYLLRPKEVEELMPKVNRPENEGIRESLIVSIIFSSLMEGEGLARSRAESLGLGLEDLQSVFGLYGGLGGREFLEWVIDLGEDEPDKTIDLQSGFMYDFAKKDLESAGEWLREFGGSKLSKDQLTEDYLFFLGQIDPAAGMNWSESIADEAKRESVKKRILLDWKHDDPQAFAELQTRHGYE